jgi:hypothetical protein
MRLGEKAKICKETYKRMGHDKTMTHPWIYVQGHKLQANTDNIDYFISFEILE